METKLERLTISQEELVTLRNELEESGISSSNPMWKQLDTIISKLEIYTYKYREKLI